MLTQEIPSLSSYEIFGLLTATCAAQTRPWVLGYFRWEPKNWSQTLDLPSSGLISCVQGHQRHFLMLGRAISCSVWIWYTNDLRVSCMSQFGPDINIAIFEPLSRFCIVPPLSNDD